MDLSLPIAPEAGELLRRDPLALLVGMILDQQVPMERAFAAPYELGRRLGHQRPPGWRTAAGPYGEPGTFRSVADVVDAGSLARVREYKQRAKAAARTAG
jgi:hypothetical protein